MILIILEIPTLKRHQTDNSSLLRLAGDLVIIKGLRRVLRCDLGGCAFAFSGSIVACICVGGDGQDLSLGEG